MKRCFIFAHYDRDCEVKPYILNELKLLNKLGDVLFISDTNSISNLEDLRGLAKYVSVNRHFLYDAYSYKIGFNYLLRNNILDTYDILYLINSSIDFPICTEEQFIKEIQTAETVSKDIWGMCKSHYLLQSYWIGIKKHVYKDLKIYFDNYKDCTNKLIEDWWKVSKINQYVHKRFINRAKQVDELTAKKWIYTVVNLECGFSKFMIKRGYNLYGITNGCWPESKLITKHNK